MPPKARRRNAPHFVHCACQGWAGQGDSKNLLWQSGAELAVCSGSWDMILLDGLQYSDLVQLCPDQSQSQVLAGHRDPY